MTGHGDEIEGKRFTLEHDVTRLIGNIFSPASVFF
jgi:DUF1365 family protein